LKVKNSNLSKEEPSPLEQKDNISSVTEDKNKNDKPKLRKVRNGSLYRRDKRRQPKDLTTSLKNNIS
jgi:hypothetical protein